jgi:hypothetical protein
MTRRLASVVISVFRATLMIMERFFTIAKRSVRG